ncbi:12567_t:CDS:2, partial [Entrophospora sp. SA101]
LKQLNWMENETSFKFGILLAKSVFIQSPSNDFGFVCQVNDY